MPFALLKVADSQPGEFVATESASEQYGKQRTITFALHPLAVWCLPECLTLFGAQPVTKPQAQFLYALNSPYSRRQVRAEEAAVCRLIRKTADRSETKVDGPGSETARLQMHSISNDHGLAERQSRLGAVPLHEFVDCMPITGLSIRAGRLLRTADFAASRSGNRRIDFALRRFSLLLGFRFMTCGLQTPQANDRPKPS